MADDTYKRMQLIQSLAEIVDELGWVIAIPPDQITPGLIVGEEKYVKAVSSAYYGTQFEVINPNENAEEIELTEDQYNELMETGELAVPVKPTLH